MPTSRAAKAPLASRAVDRLDLRADGGQVLRRENGRPSHDDECRLERALMCLLVLRNLATAQGADSNSVAMAKVISVVTSY